MVSQEGPPSALFAAEGKRSFMYAFYEPLETNRHLVELAAELRGDPINHLAAHHRLANRRLRPPLWAVLKEVQDRDRKIVVWRQQTCAFGHNPVPVVIRVAGEGDLEAILQAPFLRYPPG